MLRKNLVDYDIWIDEGTRVEIFSGANATIGTLVFRFEPTEDNKSLIEKNNTLTKVKAD